MLLMQVELGMNSCPINPPNPPLFKGGEEGFFPLRKGAAFESPPFVKGDLVGFC